MNDAASEPQANRSTAAASARDRNTGLGANGRERSKGCGGRASSRRTRGAGLGRRPCRMRQYGWRAKRRDLSRSDQSGERRTTDRVKVEDLRVGRLDRATRMISFHFALNEIADVKLPDSRRMRFTPQPCGHDRDQPLAPSHERLRSQQPSTYAASVSAALGRVKNSTR